MIKLTFLGTGPTGGLAGKGKSRRKESSALLSVGEKKILIDVTGNFEKQIKGVEKVEAVLLTHGHQDAISGMSQLSRWWRARYWDKLPVYGLKETVATIKRKFKRLEALKFITIKNEEELDILGLKIKVFEVEHSIQPGFPTIGFSFRQGKKRLLTYVSDLGKWGEEDKKYLAGAEILVIDGAMWKRQMVAHQTIKKILPEICGWKNEKIIFTQIGREVPEHEAASREVKAICPKAQLAFDGMEVKL